MIRLYGVTRGQGSLVRVTDGARLALESLGVLAGFVPVDAYDEDTSYTGGEAEVGVLAAPPQHSWLLRMVGRHARRLVLLPPNSTWVPYKLMEELRRNATGLIAPSDWAKQVLSNYASDYGLDVSLWMHGVDGGFAPDERDREQRRAEYAAGEFSVLHMSSTGRERKGSRELIEAWCTALRMNVLGSRPALVMCVDEPEGMLREWLDNCAKGDARLIRSVSFMPSRMEYTVAQAAKNYRRHHIVCQPSRGEAFGMCCTESRACGVPLVATDCTGHSAHVRQGDAGVVVVPTGGLAPVDDGPGALAPSLYAAAVCESLAEAYARWPELQEAAHVSAHDFAREWSWVEVTKQWLQSHSILSDWPKRG